MKYWLMKAEPDSRIVKGRDVKFSVEDFESVGITAWEGVRNHEAKKIMQSMKVGDQVLFYHSNCKNPGVAGFAEISKEAYPDHTAWDPDHPYYDAKSDKDSPRWFMVDATFKSRAAHFVSLALFKRIASQATDDPPEDVKYIGREGVRAIKEMALIKRGRLSVQPVEEDAWKAVQLLAEKGGSEGSEPSPPMPGQRIRKKPPEASKGVVDEAGEVVKNETKVKGPSRAKRRSKIDENPDDDKEPEKEGDKVEARSKKRKAEMVPGGMEEEPSTSRTSRRKKH